MVKLERRYTKYELATLLECIKPVERWSRDERRSWARDGGGFRHFTAVNVTPIERYRPKPRVEYNSAARKGLMPAS
jgi:hypothetical protein